MSAQSHDIVTDRAAICQVVAETPDVTLLCWLPEGHDGDHLDTVDKVHWHPEPDLAITACGHKAEAS